MALKIAVQAGLYETTQALQNAGYDVVRMEENDEPVDAVIYFGVSNDLTGFDSIDYFGGETMGMDSPRGTLLINAQGYSPEEVVGLVNSNFNGTGDRY